MVTVAPASKSGREPPSNSEMMERHSLLILAFILFFSPSGTPRHPAATTRAAINAGKHLQALPLRSSVRLKPPFKSAAQTLLHEPHARVSRRKGGRSPETPVSRLPGDVKRLVRHEFSSLGRREDQPSPSQLGGGSGRQGPLPGNHFRHWSVIC